MMGICIKQHLSNIWSLIHEKVKQHWAWVAKKRSLYKKLIFISVKASFFERKSSLIIEMIIQKNLKGLEVLITSHVKVFLAINIIALYKLL